MALLEVNGIFKRFGKTEVLKGIDFSMEKGEVLAIIGSSGSGKTTLLRCLNFLETPDSGRIVLNGDEIYNAEAKYTDREIREKRLNFGLVFQSFNLFPQYTVLRNVCLAPEMMRINQSAEKLSRADKARIKSEIEDTCLRRAFREADELSLRAFRRSAAASCDRKGACNGAGHTVLRRAYVSPRPGAHRRGAAGYQGTQGRGAHDDPGDTRDGLREERG